MKGLVYKYNVSIQSVPAVAHRLGIARSAPFLGKLLFSFHSLRTIDIGSSRRSVMVSQTISHHNCKKDTFEALGSKYPFGEYRESETGCTKWFKFYIDIADLSFEFIWFLE